MTYDELVKALEVDAPWLDGPGAWVKSIFGEIADALKNGEEVSIPGFGRFWVDRGIPTWSPTKDLVEDVARAFRVSHFPAESGTQSGTPEVKRKWTRNRNDIN